MGKKVLVISSSLRKNSNSDALAEEFARGAAESGNEVERVSLAGKNMAFCRGCLACQKTGKCVIDDDAVEIAEKIRNADIVVLATPIYYYSISGQLKTLFDRANSLYDSDYAFRSVYLLATAADGDESAVGGARKAVQGWVDCFEKAELSGVVFAGGVNDPGDVDGHDALKKAYQAGRSV